MGKKQRTKIQNFLNSRNSKQSKYLIFYNVFQLVRYKLNHSITTSGQKDRKYCFKNINKFNSIAF